MSSIESTRELSNPVTLKVAVKSALPKGKDVITSLLKMINVRPDKWDLSQVGRIIAGSDKLRLAPRVLQNLWGLVYGSSQAF